MANLLSAVLDPLKSAGDTAKGLVEIRDTAKFGGAIIELQAQILTAQQGALAAQEREATLAEEIRSLKEQVAKLEAWETEKQRYQLTDFGGGTFAYLLKPDMSESEPEHRICAACYEKRQKSILQFRGETAYQQDHYVCPACKTDFHFGERGNPPVIRTRGPRGGGGTWMGT